MSTDLLYKVALSLIPKLGPISAKKLLAYTGSIEGIFAETKSTLKKIPGLNPKFIETINSKEILSNAESEIKFIEKNNIKTLYFLDNDYPVRLTHCEDSPVLLYYKGNVDYNHSKIISIVGTRSATEYGRSFCDKLVKDLTTKGHDPIIISGLAHGIDTQAHKAALENNLKTIAVLGTALNMIYPVANTSLSNEIIDNGCLITEFHRKAIPEKSNFVRRNRIVAGMSDATIVIESAKKGGALITADIANSYNRDVFAVPGNIHNKYSEGCNKLIKTNKAALLETADDIEYILGWEKKKKPKAIQTKIFEELSDEEKVVLDVLKSENKISIDILRIKSEIPISTISSILLNLEFKGLIKSLPGKVYSVKR